MKCSERGRQSSRKRSERNNKRSSRLRPNAYWLNSRGRWKLESRRWINVIRSAGSLKQELKSRDRELPLRSALKLRQNLNRPRVLLRRHYIDRDLSSRREND